MRRQDVQDDETRRTIPGPPIVGHVKSSDLAKSPGNPKDTLILLTSIVIGGIVVYAWWNALDNWFVIYWPDGEDPKPRIVESIIITVIAVIVIYAISRIK
jgi:hypothetical protein